VVNRAEFTFGKDAAGRKLGCVVVYDDHQRSVLIEAFRGDIRASEIKHFSNSSEADEYYFGLLQREHYLRNFTAWLTHPEKGKFQ
jgi:hypothetical protein